jgi:hypothetical protein
MVGAGIWRYFSPATRDVKYPDVVNRILEMANPVRAGSGFLTLRNFKIRPKKSYSANPFSHKRLPFHANYCQTLSGVAFLDLPL